MLVFVSKELEPGPALLERSSRSARRESPQQGWSVGDTSDVLLLLLIQDGPGWETGQGRQIPWKLTGLSRVGQGTARTKTGLLGTNSNLMKQYIDVVADRHMFEGEVTVKWLEMVEIPRYRFISVIPPGNDKL